VFGIFYFVDCGSGSFSAFRLLVWSKPVAFFRPASLIPEAVVVLNLMDYFGICFGRLILGILYFCPPLDPFLFSAPILFSGSDGKLLFEDLLLCS